MRRSRERGGEEEGEKFQPHDRRLKALQGENQEHHQPQKCPRCESLNTKFCYYNNYSLSQPRYFCKACRRYWTQGGTLRNVPVGGGCRRGKRPKVSTSSSSSGENFRNIMPPNVVSSNPMIKDSNPPPVIIETGSMASPYFPSGGYASSFNQPQTFNHNSCSLGHETGSSSNLSFLQAGFSVNHLLQSEQQKQLQIQSTPFYQMNEREKIIPSLYSSHPPNWPQPAAGDGIFWTVGNSTAFNSSSRNDNASSSLSLNPSGWSNMPGYNHDHPSDPRSRSIAQDPPFPTKK